MFRRIISLQVLLLAVVLSAFSQKGIVPIDNVDSKPVFAKGKMTLSEFDRYYKKYPDSAFNAGIEGTVLVKFTVTKNGTVKNATVAKSVHKLLDNEALRVVSLFPEFEPAKLNNVNVATEMIIPFLFKNQDLSLQTQESISTDKKPLYVVDGKPMTKNATLNPELIKEIRVLKGEKAIELYGESAMDGVILITTIMTSDPLKK